MPYERVYNDLVGTESPLKLSSTKMGGSLEPIPNGRRSVVQVKNLESLMRKHSEHKTQSHSIKQGIRPHMESYRRKLEYRDKVIHNITED